MKLKDYYNALVEWQRTKSIKLASTICEQLAEDFGIKEEA